MNLSSRDIVDFNTAVSQNSSVIYATKLAHNRGHKLASSADHSDVQGTPIAGTTLVYTAAGYWVPTSIFPQKYTFTGTQNGVNTTLTLPIAPVPGQERIYLNGVLQYASSDYSISGTSVTFTVAPGPNDKLLAIF